ncbi:hypothetical protein AUC47_05730 [Microbacterium sp. SZ1]|uniref:Type 1 glutamine amidotransferase-like domain-containing protein n=1 Tax=Microbacterium sp. SZ1 TaxID=1849736 RepID=UPI000BCE2FC3|nr:Type 1 glutamine amidotransferase-like domain-containing protein [Microbacterium sp. SZ1]PCE14137.1 hypothetical protein AUC47_05730 [Microbacterium sp. SZ1]
MRPVGTVVALGGGGFSMSDDGRSAIDDHILELAGVDRPRVCFVPTASGDSADYRRRFEDVFRDGVLTEAVAERAGGTAFRVHRGEGAVIEDPIEVRSLG